MAFQLGSVVKFPSMVNAVKSGGWDRAADEMLWSNGLKKQRQSQWYKDTPNRCQKMADAMRYGTFEKPAIAKPTAPISDEAGMAYLENVLKRIEKGESTWDLVLHIANHLPTDVLFDELKKRVESAEGIGV